jgi:hypothetical protein
MIGKFQRYNFPEDLAETTDLFVLINFNGLPRVQLKVLPKLARPQASQSNRAVY